MYRLNAVERHVHRSIDWRKRAPEYADHLKRVGFMAARADVHQSMHHHDRRTDGVLESHSDLASNHDIAVRLRRTSLGKLYATVVAKPISPEELLRRADHAKTAMAVAKRVRRGPLDRRVPLPALEGRHRHRACRTAYAENGTQQYLQRAAARTNNQIDASNRTGKALAHTGANMFDPNQQCHAQGNGGDGQRRRKQSTA